VIQPGTFSNMTEEYTARPARSAESGRKGITIPTEGDVAAFGNLCYPLPHAAWSSP
jgi:hypothetical protein